MEAHVVWKGKMRFDGKTEGFNIPMDADFPLGDQTGCNPKSAVLTAIGGCAGMGIIGLLQKHHQDVDYFDIFVDVTSQSEGYPKVFTGVHIIFHIEGQVDPKIALYAIERSQDTYSGVSAMLCNAVPIRWTAVLNGERIGSGRADFSSGEDFLQSSYEG